MLLYLLLAIAGFVLLVTIIGWLLSVPGYKGPKSDHFDGNRFYNPSGIPANGIKEIGSFVKERQPDKWLSQSFEVRKTEVEALSKEEIGYTFINHSSFLIQAGGNNILTDPIFSKYCSPFQFAGPKRQRPPGVAMALLPSVDIVLISHNHYDHLDKGSIKDLLKRGQPLFVVPLGLSHIMKKWGCKKVIELDWWQSHNIDNLSITATPANHFSSRGLFDRDKTLWCGYVISLADNRKIYYTGDTGYSNVFTEIGQRLGPMDLSFIPIGAYKPEWFMGPIHISPPQAVQVHKDVHSRRSVAMHFGTFPLADDGPERAKAYLIDSLEEAGITQRKFSIPREGETVVL